MRALMIIVLLCAWSADVRADCILRGVPCMETGSDQPDFAIADFDGNGYPDIAIVSPGSSVLRLYKNQGDGTFALALEKRFAGAALKLVETGDLNGDAIPDIALGIERSVAILLNDGKGNITLRERVPEAAIALSVADFNSDTIADLAVLTRRGSEGEVKVYITTGGKLMYTQTLVVKSPVDLLAASLGSAISMDLVVSSDNGIVTVLKGSASGSFHLAATVKSTPGAEHLVAGYVNGDNRIDLVVAGSDGEAAVMLGLNESEFRRVPLSSASNIQGMGLGDFNGDQKSDLLLVNRSFRASLYTGNGKGYFAFNRGFAMGFFTGPVAVSDFNRDGQSDLLAAERGSASVFTGTGKGTFATGMRKVVDQGGSLLAGDFDADGFADLIVSSSSGSSLLRGKGNASFYPPAPVSLPQLGYATVIDLDRDGRDDVAGFEQRNLKTWLSKAETGFLQTSSNSMSIDPPVQAIDMDGDGAHDLAVYLPGSLRIVFNKGEGAFPAGTLIPLKGQKGTVADLNHDGVPDVVTIQSKENILRVYLGAPDLSFQEHARYPLGECAAYLSAGDANGDGKKDVAVGSTCKAQLTLYYGDGAGNLTRPVSIPAGSGSLEPSFADLNGDGADDLLSVAKYLGKLSVTPTPDLSSNSLLGPFYWSSFATADFDEDGHLDVAVSSFDSTALLLNCK